MKTTVIAQPEFSRAVTAVERTAFCESQEHTTVVVQRTPASVVARHTHEMTVVTPQVQRAIVALGAQGPAGRDGGGGGGEVFILDVSPTSSGIVSGKTYVNATVEIAHCLSDTGHVRIHLGCEGGADKYAPEVFVNSVAATLSESSTKRWFIGYADIVLPAGVGIVTAVSDAGGMDEALIEVLGAGPEVLAVSFGPYPGVQTQLKQGDTIQVLLTTALDASSVTVLAQGATTGATFPVVGGLAVGVLTIGNASGAQGVSAQARNAFGTAGGVFSSSFLALDQTYPGFGALTVTYHSGKAALDVGDSGTVSCSVSNYDSVLYSSSDLLIDATGSYAATKTVANLTLGYRNNGTNYTVTANRTANNATASASTLVRIATVAPTAYITQLPTGRMSGSPSGIDYTIRINPSQVLASAPTLTASHGVWQGAWLNAGGFWQRTLRITDATLRGVGTFSALTMTGLSGIPGTLITSGDGYIVGGFSARTVTFPAFSRVAPLGVVVADASKTSAQIGAQVLTRYNDTAPRATGYYIADANGAYNANGSYLALSDSAFAGANTTGTLQATVQELA